MNDAGPVSSAPEGGGEGFVTLARRALARVPDAVIITMVYLAGHGLMPLNRGLYWDDWWSYQQSRADFLRFFRESGGSIWPVEITVLMNQSMSSIWATRAICTALLLLTFLAFAAVLKSVRPIDRQDRLLTVIVAVSFPVFAARVPLADAAYVISLSLFMVAWWLAARWADSKSVWLAVAAGVLFMLSYRTPSLFVFYLLVLLFLLYRYMEDDHPAMSAVIGFAKEAWVFLLTPAVFVLWKVVQPTPFGKYQGYNQITPESLSRAVLAVPTVAVAESFLKPIALALTSLGPYAALVFAVLLVLIAPRERPRQRAARTDLALLGVGFMAFCVGVFPYVAVGKMPTLEGFESRHQLLVPFGAGLMVVYAVRLFTRRFKRGRWIGLVLILVVVAGSVAADVGKEIEYFREMYKTDAIIAQVRELPQFRTGTAFVFDDRAQDLDVSGRGFWRFYEYSGIFFHVFGDQTRFGADSAGWRSLAEKERAAQQGRGESYLNEAYKLSQFRMRDPQHLVVVTPGKPDLLRPEVMARLIWLELTDTSRFEQEVSRAVELTVSPYPSP